MLDVKPAEYFVRVIKREKRACKQCEEQGVRTAAAVERIAPKSLLSDNVIIDLLVNKYCEATPLYRQQVVLRRDAGVEVALSTLDDAVIRVGELLIPITAAMKRDSSGLIYSRRTPVGVQTHDSAAASSSLYVAYALGRGSVRLRMGVIRGTELSLASSRGSCRPMDTRR